MARFALRLHPVLAIFEEMPLVLILALVSVAFAWSVSLAEADGAFRLVDEEGVTHITDTPTDTPTNTATSTATCCTPARPATRSRWWRN